MLNDECFRCKLLNNSKWTFITNIKFRTGVECLSANDVVCQGRQLLACIFARDPIFIRMNRNHTYTYTYEERMREKQMNEDRG